ncbi:MAG: M23 family metallopeptidase [Armatimonadota bacterium]|nr:M23 family metallopeptidase [Armatimonadota bacterium]
MAKVKVYPSPATKNVPLSDSFARKLIPGGGGRKYRRAELGCLPGGAGHGGIDISGDVGDPALACIAGKISTRSFGSAFGDFQVTIIAPDQNGRFTDDSEGFFYAHLESIDVQSGDIVNAGDRIGDIGERGQATGPHIHFEHRRRWKDWCTAINCHAELERARTPIPITIRVNGVAVNSQVKCFLNENGRPAVEARRFLDDLEFNGQSVEFEFRDNPPRFVFSHPEKTNPFPLEIISGRGVAIVRDLIQFIAPQATVTLDRPTRVVDIQGGGLTL